MGNKNAEQFEWEKEYHVLERNFNDGTLVLQKEGADKQYLGREIVSSDKKEAAEIKRLIQLKLNNNNPYLTKLLKVYYNEDQAYCSSEDKIYMLFEKPMQTLKEEILARKFAGQSFSEQELDVILESGIKAIKHLKETGHPHGNISTSSLFIDEERRILLGDPWITPPTYSQQINQNAFACPSPEKILFQNDQIISICQHRSDLFSLGTVILESLNFEHMDVLYEKGFRRVIEQRVQQKLLKVKNDSLRFKLSILLSHDPRNRDVIYKQYKNEEMTSSWAKSRAINQLIQRAKGETREQEKKKVTSINNLAISPHSTNTNATPSLPHHQNHNSNYFYPPPSSYLQQHNNNNRVSAVSAVRDSNVTVKFGSGQQFKNIGSKFVNVNPKYYLTNGVGKFEKKSKYDYIETYLGDKNEKQASQQDLTSKFTTATNQPQRINTQLQPQPQHQSLPVSLKTPQPTVTGIINNTQPVSTNTSNSNMRIEEDEQKNNGFEEGKYSYNDVVNNSADLGDSEKGKSKGQVVFQHASNYYLMEKKLENAIPAESIDMESKDMIHQSYVRKSENSDKGFLDAVNEAQNANLVTQINETPERRPKKKYNSTIKEVDDENSFSDSREDSRSRNRNQALFVIEELDAGRYEGYIKNNLRNGKGKFFYHEGSVYDGDWKDNMMHGIGKLYYSNGNVAYDGEWRNDEFHGEGKVYNEEQKQLHKPYNYKDFSDIDDYWCLYEGTLNSDRRHGKGMIKLSNGEIFRGYFTNDFIDGEGKFFTLNGDIINGVWRQNKLVHVMDDKKK